MLDVLRFCAGTNEISTKYKRMLTIVVFLRHTVWTHLFFLTQHHSSRHFPTRPEFRFHHITFRSTSISFIGLKNEIILFMCSSSIFWCLNYHDMLNFSQFPVKPRISLAQLRIFMLYMFHMEVSKYYWMNTPWHREGCNFWDMKSSRSGMDQ